jgi:hypothetical protein
MRHARKSSVIGGALLKRIWYKTWSWVVAFASKVADSGKSVISQKRMKMLYSKDNMMS